MALLFPFYGFYIGGLGLKKVASLFIAAQIIKCFMRSGNQLGPLIPSLVFIVPNHEILIVNILTE
jgi:hypothetical protein